MDTRPTVYFVGVCVTEKKHDQLQSGAFLTGVKLIQLNKIKLNHLQPPLGNLRTLNGLQLGSQFSSFIHIL